jgi:hypothetical protein
MLPLQWIRSMTRFSLRHKNKNIFEGLSMNNKYMTERSFKGTKSTTKIFYLFWLEFENMI